MNNFLYYVWENLRQHKIQMDKFALKLFHANMSEYTEDLVGINQNNK